MLFFDTETCGFHGVCVLIQYAENDDDVQLWEPWRNPAIETLKLIEWMCTKEVCGFNLAFDWFHIQKLYNLFSMLPDLDVFPEDHVDLLGNLEPDARIGQCVKPVAACDLMLHARQGKYQSLMARKDIYIRKIPTLICQDVHEILEESVVLDEILFARRKDKLASKWAIVDRDDTVDFKDIVLRFRASSSLKALAAYALGETNILKYGDIEIEKEYRPLELGYAPFAKAIEGSVAESQWFGYIMKGQKRHYGRTWPGLVKYHISHWAFNRLAREYGVDDVLYTRKLWYHLESPEAGDDNSELACMVGSVRWRGYDVDLKGIEILRDAAVIESASAPKAPGAVRNYLTQVMDPIEKAIVAKSTKKVILEEVAKWENDCEQCEGEGEDSEGSRCELCKGTGSSGKHPAALRAAAVLGARQAKAEVVIFNKLLRAGRFHASFSVIGALSGRMSGGGGGFNPQGIKRSEEIRSKFGLADPGYELAGGDFDSFEVVIAISYYGDEKLAEAVKSGKKIHALFGLHVYPGMTYEEILNDKERYNRSKSAVFAMIYGGEAFTLKSRLGVDIEVAEAAFQSFITEYAGIGRGRQRIFESFCSMKQRGGIGSRIEWDDPDDHIESMLGFRRYFTLENQICATLYKIAERPPKSWNRVKGKVVRREREQTVAGAARSAIFAAAFAIQAANMRAAGNHVIQSTGAGITKRVQRRVWDVQPAGVGEWKVVPMNIHDEVMAAHTHDVADVIKNNVDETVEYYRPIVELIGMTWKKNLDSWAGK